MNMSVATTRYWNDSQTNERKEETEWSRIVLFGRPADFASHYARKGNLVYVEGRLQTRKWTDDRSGQDRYTTEIVGNEFRLLERRDSESSRSDYRGDSSASRGGSPSNASSGSTSAPIPDDPLDDIPW